MTQDHPVLALDVDGVISLFGFEGPIGEAPGRFHLINGMAHCIPEGIGHCNGEPATKRDGRHAPDAARNVTVQRRSP